MFNGCSWGVVAPESSELALVAGAHVLASLSLGGEWFRLGGPGPPLQGAAGGPLRRLAFGSVTPTSGFMGGRLDCPVGPSARGFVFVETCRGSDLPLESYAFLVGLVSAWLMIGPSHAAFSLHSSAGGTYESM